ncbi:MAG: hypothetical protein B6D36_13565 [Planctomycetes bacterium UTPLA1]|jgi:hypothetical protein|nr:MAG: hypothetical protein B6D36_13565 [Planctomycetes bacterium UTPLA1]
MQRVEALPADALDDRLIFHWVALNSLYGQWDNARREPQPDVITLRAFLSHLLPLDEHGTIAGILNADRSMVMSIFEDAYLTKFFWEEPSQSRAQRSMSKRHKANSWYLEGQFGLILEEMMLRLYVLRCQLVHGAATYGGNLNRSAIQRCTAMLNALLPPFVLVMMDAGVNKSWGPLCYPPRPIGDR